MVISVHRDPATVLDIRRVVGASERLAKGVARMPITDVSIRNAKPSQKSARLFDERGLYLEIAPAGGKWWRLKYRFRGKERRLSLGVYPDVGLKEARDRRDAARKLLANGVDPSEHRKAQNADSSERAENSFGILAREWFAKYSANWAAGHSDRILRHLERDIFPWIGNRPITAITAPELLGVVRRIEARGALDTAHRAFGTCGQVFRYGVATSRAERDLTSDLRGALPPVEGSHFAATTEPSRVGEFCGHSTATKVHFTFAARCALCLWCLCARENCARLSGST